MVGLTILFSFKYLLEQNIKTGEKEEAKVTNAKKKTIKNKGAISFFLNVNEE